MPKITPPDSMMDLRRLRRPGRGIRTSDGSFYGGSSNIWGRDAAITADDLIDIDPKISEEAIVMLSELQGTDHKLRSGEKPGRIHTEHRDIYDKNTMGLFWKLGLSFVSRILWRNDNWREYTNYYSSDTTPLYIKLVYDYSRKYPEILNQVITRKNGQKDTIKNCVIKASEYISSTVDDEGLIKIKEHTPAGNQFRYWRDSPSSYRDENGQLPNILNQMVILDIQVLCAESLNLSAEIIKNDNPKQAENWEKLARKIQNATIKNFWIEKDQFFAFAMDKSKRGHMKILTTIQSNSSWMLNSDFFDNLEDDVKQKYLSSIIKRMFSEEFLTDAGIRCRSRKYIYHQVYQDYHGSWVTWPVESYMFAKGLRRQGFDKLAEQIEARITNAINICGVNYEFFVVDLHGKVLLNPKRKISLGAKAVELEILPECTIAWTVTASLKINKQRQLKKYTKKNQVNKKSWQWKLENEILNQIKCFSGELTDEEINYYIESEPNIYVNQFKGFWQSAKTIAKEFGPAIIKNLIKNK